MSREEVIETDPQQTTSTNKESREIPISTTAPKKSASHPSLHAQHSQFEQSSTAESSQEIKISSGRKQQKDKNKDIKSNNTCQSVSGKDIINNKLTSNGNTSTKTSDDVDENSNTSFNHDGSISNGDTDHDPFHENENGISIPRRQSMNDNSQKSLKSHSMHQRHNSTPISSSINIVTTNTSISTSPPPSSPSSSSSSNNNSNNDNTNPDNTNNNANTNTITSTNTTYSNGINMQSQMYEETPQISYSNMNQTTPYIPVPSQYYTPFYPNNGQYFYDPQYNRFGRPPPQIPPSAQQTFVRSNVYPYHQIPVIPPIHPPPYHNPSPLMPHQSVSTRYLNPSSATTGGDSGFSSRRSSLDQVRTPEFGPQHPPRIHQQKKPKQLDKALWVGNLPDSTTQDDLKEFFADENMESVFHIKKSNCAFVNYKTYEAVIEAVQKYNEIEFKGIKLVCRPRKQTPADLKLKTESLSALISENTPPPTPSEAGSTASSTRSRRSSLPPRQRIRQPSIASMSPASSVSSLKPSSQNRYFILKSLTQDDLDISVKSGYWATQPHNEAALNKAFKSAENVYLIFSANKSGEFYGYARMLSPISKETTETVQWTPIDEAALAASSSRLSPNQDESKLRKKSQDEESEDCEDDAVPSRNWGTTFKVEWIKVQKLPFIRTRQLRNPWNANREVKISRDGTEVEPVVGERLLAEFHKSPQTLPTSYSNISGPLLTQPLNIDGQGVIGEGQDRMLVTQNGAQIPPMMDPNFMPNAQPAFFTPAPGYWHPQPIIIPPYGAPPAPPGYVPQQAWTASSSKDQPVGVTRVQPAQPSIVAGSPMMSLDQQQYVEVIWGPMQHPPHYQSVPTPHLYQPSAGVHYQQAPPQQYYRPSEDNGHVDSHMSYQVSPQQQEQNMSNDQESEPHMVTSYLMEEQSAETSSNA